MFLFSVPAPIITPEINTVNKEVSIKDEKQDVWEKKKTKKIDHLSGDTMESLMR